MSTFTPNFNLEKPDSTDDFKDFRSNYNSNMDIIDQNLGGGGSSVSWSQLQVTGDKIATIRISGINTDVFTPNSQTFSMAVSRININSDETYPTIFGKIKKWFNDLKTVAFSGSYNDLSDQPTIPTATSELNNDSDFVSDASYVHTDNNFTNADVTKLSGIQSGAEVNVQSDWNEADNTADDYIKNKPTIPTVNDGTLTIRQNGTTVGTFTANQSGNTIVNLTGGGGSAHTIVNESGTSLADEPNLQFTDGLKATDDSVNSKTVVGVNTTFTEAVTRTNIASGDTFATILGKIKKFFTDLKAVAFSGSYNDLSDKPTIPVGSDYVQKSGDTMSGNLTVDRQNGTTLATAWSAVVLGNNTPSGTDKNSFGVVRLYGENQAYTDIYAPNTTTQNRDITFPNKNGTVALTSDLDVKIPLFQTFSDSLASCLGRGEYNYFKLATLTITSSYVNGAIAFELSQRQYEVTMLQVCFASASNPDPNLSYFKTNQRNNYWIVKENTSVWGIYGQYNESHGGCALHRVTGYRVSNGVNVQIEMTNVTSVPAGATQCTYGGNCEYAISAGTATDNTKVSKSGDTISGNLKVTGDVNVEGTLNADDFLNIHSSVFDTLLTLSAPSSMLSNLNVQFPNKSGTVAMTSDVPLFAISEISGTNTAKRVTFSGKAYRRRVTAFLIPCGQNGVGSIIPIAFMSSEDYGNIVSVRVASNNDGVIVDSNVPTAIQIPRIGSDWGVHTLIFIRQNTITWTVDNI